MDLRNKLIDTVVENKLDKIPILTIWVRLGNVEKNQTLQAACSHLQEIRPVK